MRHLIPKLSPPVWRLLGADALSALGTGLTLPFLLVYLHGVRGLGIGVTSAVIASIGVVSLVGNPLGGWLADRYGARPALLGGLLVSAAGALGWLAVTGPLQAFTAAAVYALGASVAVTAQSTLLGRLCAPAERSNAFAVGHMTLNTGLGAGGLIAALAVRPEQAESFTTLYALDAATFLAAATIVATMVPGGARPDRSALPDGGGQRSTGYADVLRDRTFLLLWIVTALLVTVGFSQIAVTLPAVAVGHAGLPSSYLGLIHAANTVTVVVCQLLVLRLVEGRRRTRAITALALIWSLSWLLVLVAGQLQGSPLLALLTLISAMAVFALGETLMAPTIAPMANDLAPDALRGRYNGALLLAYTCGFALGPLMAGALLDNGLVNTLLLGLAGLSAASVLVIRRLEARMPQAANLVPGRDDTGVHEDTASSAAGIE
ncbi:MFS transporter [Streptomyces sp. Lzd4kr]|nr:MFS transporter [Streptomyces sp. Lzd4kr]